MARKLLALLLLLVATPAFAASYIGTVPSDGHLSFPIPFGPGKYQLRFAFGTPVPFDVTIHTEEHYNFFWVDTGDYIGGDDNFYLDTHAYHVPTTTGTVQWTIDPAYSYTFNDIYVTGYYNGVDADFDFYADPGATVAYRIDISAVPEPAHWVLLIGGFGLAGAVLRRRRPIAPRREQRV
ncbi:PEPxxWA-CTERM sorting domain-containing protein [Sphingomonas sp.]|uniref:PEPxxWA-CTERM sorting domain-containing protein n=1 Tax=Sphingomonas sp. TaxID=28214 RepID=UPI0028A6FE38|nr:PEPxxWA-CTERM sorting domain-containing protein [Sphingomonas sp.]